MDPMEDECAEEDPVLSLDQGRLLEITQAWDVFSSCCSGLASLSSSQALQHVQVVENKSLMQSMSLLSGHGLQALMIDFLLNLLEESFKKYCLAVFWARFDNFIQLKGTSQEIGETTQLYCWIQSTLPCALRDISVVKSLQEESISAVVKALQEVEGPSSARSPGMDGDFHRKHQTSATALLLTSAPKHFSEILNLYFKARLEDFSGVARKHACCSAEKEESEDESQVGAGDTRQSDVDLETNQINCRKASGFIEDMEDMEVIGSGCVFRTPHGKKEDPDGGHDMEGVVFPSFGDTNLHECNGVAEVAGSSWVPEVGGVVRDLQQLGFSALTEEACASAVYLLLRENIHAIATKLYEKPVLAPIRKWIKAIPLQFLQVVLNSNAPVTRDFVSPCVLPSPLASNRRQKPGCSGEPNERIIRWHLRLEFFAYETLGDLRISELFDIIVDYPESLAAIEDLRQCLSNTGHHSKLVDSFRTALRHRLLTAGAATTDILLQYISTIKALRTMDHTGVYLEAVGEPIREYLRGRKDTIRCIVTMLTEDTGAGAASSLGGAAESLLEELSRGSGVLDNIDSEDEGVVDDEEAWATAKRWEPDPVEADPSRTSKSRRSMDIIGMLVGIYGSKELFVNEYRIMLAEKLLNKLDYDIDREIRTLELLKLRFGESSMHSCEIMLKDIADSKRINSNIKASISNTLVPSPALNVQVPTSVGPGAQFAPLAASLSRNGDPGSRLAAFVARARGVFSPGEATAGSTSNVPGEKMENDLCLEVVDTTIISSLFWPPLQAETVKVPRAVDDLLEDYAQRYHALKAPRKLQWKKHLGIVKLELQFEDRAAQFMVSPMHASIIMKFEGCSSWSASDLAAALEVPVSTLRRRIMLWVNQGVLLESSSTKPGELYYTIVEIMGDSGPRNGAPSLGPSDAAVPLLGEEEGESGVASMEDQLQQEMNVYESYVLGMLTNFDALPLDRIHNMLKMFVSDPPYDKSLQQLQAFLAGLVSEEKLEIRDGLYRRRQQ